MSVSGSGDSVWVALLKPLPAKIVLSTGVYSMSGKDSALFILGGDKVSHFNHSSDWLETFVYLFLVPCLIEVSCHLSISMRLKARPACRRDLIKLSAKSPNTAAC